MAVSQKLSPTDGGGSTTQNYRRADQLRDLGTFVMSIAGVDLVPLSFTCRSSSAFMVQMLLMGCFSVTYGPRRYIIYARIHQAERRWHCDGIRAAFVPPWPCETGEILVNSVMTLLSLLSLYSAVLSGLNEPGGTRVF